MNKLYKIVLAFTIFEIISVLHPILAFACTYQSTITGKHVDFQITSDPNLLGLIQYIRQSGSSLVTQLYSAPVGEEWIYSDDPNCDVYSTHPIACRQIRSTLGDGAFWYWSVNGDGEFPNHPLPTGIWGMDFDIAPTYDSIGIEYGSPNGEVGDFWTFCTRTGEVQTPSPTATPIQTETPSPTLTPTPTPTTTPAPTPTSTITPTPTSTVKGTPTPGAVTKVFFIPGIGASWNADALINCKDSGYSGGWTLASYAKDAYQEVLTQLNNHGWNTIPFYYDWRNDIRKNSTLLNFSINSTTGSSEKINLVGHSMGGLIGRNYLESQNGGKASKFLAVGVPNQGAALAYPALINNEVWSNDLVFRIGTTLYLNHCGITESFKNLLPTYNYLRDNKTNWLKEITTMKTKNNYLPTSFVSPFWGVKVGTLAGTGRSTLKTMDVAKDNKWPDGKPIYKEYVYDGDDTVLIQSAQIPGAFSNDVIRQSHSGIVASTEGINKILEFLGSPGIADPPYIEPTSALIIVGYPGNFWVTDKDGVTTQSENGLISLTNPKDGDYQLQIVPNSTSTTFIVGQFLRGGKTLYKEYKFNGLVQDPKIVEFDSKHPDENIIHEVREFKSPHFPKFWFEFWRFWNKFHR